MLADPARLLISNVFTVFQRLGRSAPYLLVLLGIVVLLGRALVTTVFDSSQCFSLVQDGGFWLDPSPTTDSAGYYNRWQPQSCTLHNYTWNDITTCMPNGKINFAGDSTIVGPYVQFVNWYRDFFDLFHDRLGPLALTHESMAFPLGGMEIRVFWDPFLNYEVDEYWKTRMGDEIPDKYNSSARHELAALQGSTLTRVTEPASFMFIGTGLWELQNNPGDTKSSITEMDEYLNIWLDRLDILDEATDIKNNPLVQPRPPGLFLINPIQEPDPTKIEKYKDWLSLKATKKMNNWLRSRKIVSGGLIVFSFNAMTPYKATMMETSGHHAHDEVNRRKNNLLMNWRCNQVLSDIHELPITSNGLCCIAPSVGPLLQWLLTLATAILIFRILMQQKPASETLANGNKSSQASISDSNGALPPTSDRLQLLPLTRFSGIERALEAASPFAPIVLAILLSLLADRTFFLATHQKYFSFRFFLLYNTLVFLTMVFTQSSVVDDTEDSGFFKNLSSRLHTDEWKGWMTLVACGIEYFSPLSSLSLQGYYNFQAAAFVFLFALGNTNYLLTSQQPRPLLSRVLKLNLLPLCLALFLPGTGSNAVLCFTMILSLTLILFEALLYIHRNKGSSLVYASIPPLASLCSVLILHGLTPVFGIITRPIKEAIQSSFPSFNIGETFTLCAIFLHFGHIAGFFVRPSHSNDSTRTLSFPSPFHNLNGYKAAALGVSTIFVLFTLLVMPAHLSLRRSWVPGFANVEMPTLHPTVLTTVVPAIIILLYPPLRIMKPIRRLYSPLMASIGNLSLEIYALRQHLWLGADGSAITRLTLIDRWLPAGPLGRRIAFFSRAFDMLLLGALVVSLARLIRGVDLSVLVDDLSLAWDWVLNRSFQGRSLRERFLVSKTKGGAGEEIEVSNLLGNGHADRTND